MKESMQRLIEVLHIRRNLRAEAHLAGHMPDPELCFPREIGGHGQLIDQIPEDEEIILFIDKPLKRV